MLRTAIVRSAGAAAAVRRTAAVCTRRLASSSSPRAVGVATGAAAFRSLRAGAGGVAVRYYSAGGDGLKKEEVEGRIMALLQNFDKVGSLAPWAAR